LHHSGVPGWTSLLGRGELYLLIRAGMDGDKDGLADVPAALKKFLYGLGT